MLIFLILPANALRVTISCIAAILCLGSIELIRFIEHILKHLPYIHGAKEVLVDEWGIFRPVAFVGTTINALSHPCQVTEASM